MKKLVNMAAGKTSKDRSVAENGTDGHNGVMSNPSQSGEKASEDGDLMAEDIEECLEADEMWVISVFMDSDLVLINVRGKKGNESKFLANVLCYELLMSL